MPKVSVLMLSYNYAKYLPTAIDSVLNQSYKDFEMLIIDDSSQDNSADIIRQYASIDKRVHYMINERNEGIVSSFNHGLSQCQGDYIAYISSDDVWTTDRLTRGVDVLDNLPDIDWVYSNIDIIDGEGVFLGKTARDVYPSPSGKYNGNLFSALLRSNFIIGSSMMWRCRSLGNLKLNGELKYQNDWLFYIELAEHGQFHYLIDTLGAYRVHSSNTSVDKTAYLKDRIRLVEIICRRYRNFLQVNKSILAKHYLDIGVALCLNSQYTEGKRYLKRAATVFPVNMKAYAVLLLLLLSNSLFKRFIEGYFKFKNPIAS